MRTLTKDNETIDYLDFCLEIQNLSDTDNWETKA